MRKNQRRGGHLELPEGPAGGPSRDLARVPQRLRQRLERVVKGERQVPRLRREDHQDRRELEPHIARREQRHQAEHEAGKEAQHRDALEDVEQRQQQPLGGAGLGGRPPVRQREEIGDHERRDAARQRIQRVTRQRRGAQVDLHRLRERRLEFARERDQRRDDAAQKAEDRDVGEPGWGVW